MKKCKKDILVWKIWGGQSCCISYTITDQDWRNRLCIKREEQFAFECAVVINNHSISRTKHILDLDNWEHQSEEKDHSVNCAIVLPIWHLHLDNNCDSIMTLPFWYFIDRCQFWVILAAFALKLHILLPFSLACFIFFPYYHFPRIFLSSPFSCYTQQWYHDTFSVLCQMT